MIFEDAHWIDPTSRELLDLMVDRVARLPALMAVTFRPEFEHGWGGQPHVLALALNRLGGHEGAALVARLTGDAGLAHDTIEEIVARADGVPLFVEELTKAVLESGDPSAALSGEPVAGTGDPGHPARLADRALRSAGAARSRGGADRRGLGPRVRL